MIDTNHYNLAILLMAVITFSVRYVFFATHFKIKLSDNMRLILLFTAPCILTAMFVPIMFQDMFQEGLIQEVNQGASQAVSHSARYTLSHSLIALFSSSYFWGSMFAIVCSLFIRNTLIVIILSLTFFYGFRYFV